MAFRLKLAFSLTLEGQENFILKCRFSIEYNLKIKFVLSKNNIGQWLKRENFNVIICIKLNAFMSWKINKWLDEHLISQQVLIFPQHYSYLTKDITLFRFVRTQPK